MAEVQVQGLATLPSVRWPLPCGCCGVGARGRHRHRLWWCNPPCLHKTTYTMDILAVLTWFWSLEDVLKLLGICRNYHGEVCVWLCVVLVISFLLSTSL